MCSFLFTNKHVDNIENINFLLKKRGPDLTNYENIDNFFYLHNLLSITGEITKQPIYDKESDIVLIYNGEIYNYKDFGDFKSDGYSIVELYKSKGSDCFKELDGEFAILLHDKRNNKIIISSDTFGTKPLYYSVNDLSIGVSSYRDPLEKLGFSNIERFPSNTTIEFDDSNFNLLNSFSNYIFNLDQYKETHEDWKTAFYESVRKRTKDLNHKILVPLSSGYDSGLICCVLDSIEVDYVSYSIIGKENKNILLDRININKNSFKEVIPNINHSEISKIKEIFESDVQRFFYGPNPNEYTHNGFDDPGAIGLYYVLSNSKIKYNTKIVLSGHGSDEMMTNIPNYGFKTSTPCPFPDRIDEIFPWGNFYLGSQWSYLMKEECIAGSLGIETRYPFLDKKVVQEFINLRPDLKNKFYKYPIKYIFNSLKYPYIEEKIGFQIE